MVNLENFLRWNLNEGSLFSDFKWVSAPKGLTWIQKLGIEGKMSAFGSDFFESVNFSYTSRYWESLKKRLIENKIKVKYGDSAVIPKQWIYWGEKVIYSDQRPLLSKNVEKQKVVAYYPVAYNGAALDKFWVVAVWKNTDGKKYLKEMTLKDFLSRSTKEIIDKDFLSASSVKTDVSQQNKINKKDYWTLITIIACENYTDQTQGMADVAQSIYNRYHVSGKPYGKTISEIILAKGQYEPVSKGTKKGADWRNITDKAKAISVYSKTKGLDIKNATKAIEAAIYAQSLKDHIDKAKTHVKTRTEFLASSPTSSSSASPVERVVKDKNNSFFWNYAGKKNYYAKNDFTAKPMPPEVKTA
jgi:hypothetical protein